MLLSELGITRVFVLFGLLNIEIKAWWWRGFLAGLDGRRSSDIRGVVVLCRRLTKPVTGPRCSCYKRVYMKISFQFCRSGEVVNKVVQSKTGPPLKAVRLLVTFHESARYRILAKC